MSSLSVRVLVEILVRAELQTIDEDARDDGIAVLARKPHQRQVSFVQIAHRRHEGRTVLAAQLIAQFLDRADDFHLESVSLCALARAVLKARRL